MQTTPTADNSWRFTRKFLFRFLSVYLFLYCFPYPFDAFDFTKPVAKPYYDFLDYMIPQLGEHWFHLKAKTAFPFFDKFDDSYYGLVHLYITLILALVAAVIWSIFDRGRINYERCINGCGYISAFFLSPICSVMGL